MNAERSLASLITHTQEIPMPGHYSRAFETELHFQVKSYDVDYVGYVHNAVYIRWLEDLRVAMLFDNFIGRVWVSKLEGVRWTVNHELVHDTALVATAEQNGIFINLQTHRPVAAPQELAQKFLAYQQPVQAR
jgi:acyl-CoA thioester hydrolase